MCTFYMDSEDAGTLLAYGSCILWIHCVQTEHLDSFTRLHKVFHNFPSGFSDSDRLVEVEQQTKIKDPNDDVGSQHTCFYCKASNTPKDI